MLTDVDPARVESALETVRGELASQVAKGRYSEGKARFLGSLVSGGAGLEAYAGCELVLEAVFEEIPVKRRSSARWRRSSPTSASWRRTRRRCR